MQTGSLWVKDKKKRRQRQTTTHQVLGKNNEQRKPKHFKGGTSEKTLVQPLAQSSASFDQVTNNDLLQV